MFSHHRRWLGAILALGLLSLAPLSRAQDKAVYYDANYSTGWLADSAGRQVRDYFTSRGYQLVDAAGLKTFMQSHVTSKAPSILIMGRDIPPDTVVDVSSGSVTDTGNLLVDYMTNGGRIVQIGDWPFYNIGLTGGGNLTPQPGPAGATTILGIPGSDTSTGCTQTAETATPTAEGTKEGLTQTWSSARPIPDTTVDVVLAEKAEGANVDGGCASGWIKKFGTGEFVRLIDTTISNLTDAQLQDVQKVAEYGLVTPSGDTVPPAAITNLATTNPTNNSITLTFTAPADTGTGSSGNAVGYEVRYGLQPITAANVSTTSRAGGPVPGQAGAQEFLAISNLDPLQHYYFAVISHDAGGNASPLSNVVDGSTLPNPLPSNLPAVTDKAVYYDSAFPGAWITDSNGQQIMQYFTDKGYQLLDSTTLAGFMQSHVTSKAPSAIVLAEDILPDTVIDISSGSVTKKNLIGDYLNNGGRVIHYGDIPFYNIYNTSDGSKFNAADNGGVQVLGFKAAGGTWDKGDISSIAPGGQAFGLTSTWTSVRPASPSDVDVVLETAAGGAAGWIKFYPNINGPGFFARLVDSTPSGNLLTDAQLADGQKLAEFSGAVTLPIGRINGVVSDPQGNPVSGATVKIAGANGVSFNATTNAQGGYSVQLAPGAYTVSGRAATAAGVISTFSNSAATTVTAGQVAVVPASTANYLTLPNLPTVTDKAVFFDPNTTTSWVNATNAQQISDYFQGKGYTVVDAAALKTFMQSHAQSKTPSVVVQAQDILPDSVIDLSSGGVTKTNIVNDYLNNGGRIVFAGDIPFYNVFNSTTAANLTAGDAGSATVLGFSAGAGARDKNDTTVITAAGQAVGLKSTWLSARPALTSDVDLVLESSSGGAAGWLRFYPDVNGPGYFARLYDLNQADPLSDDQLADLQTLAELHGTITVPGTGNTGGGKLGDINNDGKINVQDATLALRAAVSLVTLTPAQVTAADVNKDGKVNVQDATKILRVAVGLDTLPAS